ncbi:MAG: ABC transporter ATP-binding protein, partial [Clostridiales bacterium]|nr:ABC transporter ATP-binding protein [Clostridiales bacterium]
IIAIMMVIGAFLETLGVGLILPLVSAITTPDLITTNRYAIMVCELLDLHTARTFMIVVIAALILVYIFKNIYLFLEYYVQYRFICNNRFAVQRQLMEVYLGRPYEYFLNIDSGEVVRVITTDTINTFQLLSTVLGFFTEAVVSAALIITIIVTDPFMACLMAGILGFVMFVIGKVIKPILKKAGLSYQKNTGRMNKWLLQSISGIKEIKVGRKEDYFLEQFSQYGKKAIDSERMNNVLGTVPRLSIEAIGISAMLAVIAFLMFKGREVDTMLPQLSAFAMAAVRLMPSVNRMSAALNMMAYQEPALDKMLEHLAMAKKWEEEKYGGAFKASDESQQITMKRKTELADITYCYPNTETPVLSHAKMEIPVGKSVGVVGTSGSGKTTAIDILLGLLPPQDGLVLSDGVDIREDYSGWLSHIGYIPQMIFMLDDTIRANIAFGIPKDDVQEEKVWKALEEAQLLEFVKGLPQGLDTTIGERGVRLSGGQRQRIGIARALYLDPELLIFDEATSALDNETEAAIMESIHRLHGKKTMIIIAHRLATIEDCDIVYRVENGHIVRER